ncbi:cadherin-87A-like [Amphibalanus amphitrite]|uniref:cadherin-87A-like n=1 Tax=Amphibalanus amphitrite TaxID=1232801 RepID=UPI001C9164BC|nr:cadherin-87A-like [Amphibalanus amphitrite]XP_043212989.1 cadherin-87A-like [Amphibalanus amphitrite]
MYLHVADGRQQIVPTGEVLRAFDLHYDYIQREHGALNVQKVQAADAAPTSHETNQTLVTLVALLLVLVIGLVTFCAVCCCLKTVPVAVPSYKEQVKQPPQPPTPRASVDQPETPPGTENPLWIGNKLKMYEEQELSMQVSGDPEAAGGVEDSPSPQEEGQNTYATIQRPGEPAEHSPNGDTADYATLGRYSSPTLPLGPTIPGVVPARERLPGVPPPPPTAAQQSGADSRHRRLSVGRDGRPELVSELQ